jgi:hypothetical protein
MGRFRLSLGPKIGLVVALAIALFCNIYLVVMIWSSSGQNQVLSDIRTTASSSVHVSELFESKLASINNVNYNLNVQLLSSLLLNPDKRLIKKPDKSIISLVNSIKRQLKPRGEPTENLLASINKVRGNKVIFYYFYYSKLMSIFIIVLFTVGVTHCINSFLCTRTWRCNEILVFCPHHQSSNSKSWNSAQGFDHS